MHSNLVYCRLEHGSNSSALCSVALTSYQLIWGLLLCFNFFSCIFQAKGIQKVQGLFQRLMTYVKWMPESFKQCTYNSNAALWCRIHSIMKRIHPLHELPDSSRSNMWDRLINKQTKNHTPLKVVSKCYSASIISAKQGTVTVLALTPGCFWRSFNV